MLVSQPPKLEAQIIFELGAFEIEYHPTSSKIRLEAFLCLKTSKQP